MTGRDAFLGALTFKNTRPVPFMPGWPRESTLKAWRSDGLPEGAHYMDELSRILSIPSTQYSITLPCTAKMIEQFEEKVLEHRDGHYIVSDWMGNIVEISDEFDYTYLRSAKDFVTRKWHKFAVESKADFGAIKSRYDPDEPRRLAGVKEAMERADSEQLATVFSVNGAFWQMREWLGLENLCIAMAERDQLIDEMEEFWRAFVIRLFENLTQAARVDQVYFSEDMAYKAHSMISPEMTKRYVTPLYRQLGDLARRKNGEAIVEVDSDGYIGTLIPLYIDSGVNVSSPVEVAAHNDIAAFRREYGSAIAFRGGVDKREMARGGAALRAELERIKPVIDSGGYIPSCDHGVPPDISWHDFIDYAGQLHEMLE